MTTTREFAVLEHDVADRRGAEGGGGNVPGVSTERLTRYHLARQNDGRGWMLLRLDRFGSNTARVVLCNLPEADARAKLDDLRATEVS